MKPTRRMRVLKTSLSKIIDRLDVIYKINDVVQRCKLITMDIYDFLKAYFIYLHDNKEIFPQIDIGLLCAIFNIVTTGPKTGRKITSNKELYNNMNKFYLENYSKLGLKKQDRTNLSHIFKYIFGNIITNFKNNVTLNFTKYINSYIRMYLRENKLNMTNKKVLSLTEKILSNDEPPSKLSPLETVIFYRVKSIRSSMNKPSLADDIDENPQKYIKTMIYITRKIEDFNKTIVNQNEKMRLYCTFPSSSSFIPSYIPIDTTIILDILCGDGKAKYYNMKMAQKRDELWFMFFSKLMVNNTFSGTHKSKYIFSDLIYTDGIGVSIVQVTPDLYGKKIKNTIKTHDSFKYFDDLEEDVLRSLKDKTILGVDPGKRNQVYITDGKKVVRYTTAQRYSECGFTLKAKYMWKIKENTEMMNIETELSKCNSKSCYEDEFYLYLITREQYKPKMISLYFDPFFRIQKWKTYIRTQISEQKLINRIINTFDKETKGKNIILAYGDWSTKQHMKHYRPTKGVGLKKLLAKEFKTYNINEYNTSCKCSHCGSYLEKFMKRANPRPNKQNEIILVNGLLRCSNGLCGKYFDRDKNGGLNHRSLALHAIHGFERPTYLCKSKDEHKKHSSSFDEDEPNITQQTMKTTNKIYNKLKSKIEKSYKPHLENPKNKPKNDKGNKSINNQPVVQKFGKAL